MFSLDDRFVSLFQARDPMAILITLHYAAGLHFLTDKWFVGRLGEQLIKGLCPLLPSPAPSPAFAASTEWTRVHVGMDKRLSSPNYLSTPSTQWPVVHGGLDQGLPPRNPPVSTLHVRLVHRVCPDIGVTTEIDTTPTSMSNRSNAYTRKASSNP